ncbi:MAG TPA: DUF397 domain-containing protein [Trebonia sp.]|nr:DUF397 domain-containing protein [Trebonia sp.]
MERQKRVWDTSRAASSTPTKGPFRNSCSGSIRYAASAASVRDRALARKDGAGMGSWRKSTHSDANGGQCVETASADGAVMIRDTGDRGGCTLGGPASAWTLFLSTLR